MKSAEEIKAVGILGGGLIGQSWASLFAACGLDVVVCDPAPSIHTELSDFVTAAWPNLVALGIALDDRPVIPRVTMSVEDLAEVDFVQENGPDRIEVKRQMLAELEAVIGPDVVIASSTSSLTASQIQKGAAHPGRILVGHPMNPPHLVPLVEIVGGTQTQPGALHLAQAFYERCRRVPVRLKKEVVGHLANRLTSALYREAVHIAASGIADVEDIDKAIAHGPGLRWALMGPHLTYHLGGGKGGYRHYLDHLGPTQEARWQYLGTPELTEVVKETLVAGVERELDGMDRNTLTARRDAALVDLLRIKKTHDF